MIARMSRRGGIAALLALAFVLPGLADAPSTSPAPRPKPAITVPTGADIAAAAELSGDIAFIVVDVATGQVLEAGNPDLPLPPASVAKVPTALYALSALGPDHRFETRLVEVGTRVGDTLKGDLILQGGGDPEVDTAALDLLLFRAIGDGLRRVEGRFLVDDSLIPYQPEIDETQPDVASYNPSISGVNLNFNRVHVEWKRSGTGYAIDVLARSDTLSTPTDAVKVAVADTTVSPAFDYVPMNGEEHWRVRAGAMGQSGARWLPVRQPALYAGRVLRDLADKAGLTLPPAAPGPSPLVAEVTARIESRRLSDILADMLRYSTNLTAEAVGLSATRASGGGLDTLSASGQAMSAWAAGFAGFPPGDPGMALTNHSGLSGDSRASVRRLTDLLIAAEARGFPSLDGGRGATLRALLPMRPYLEKGEAEPAIAATVRAKTGTLNFTSALAGYIDLETGRRLAFAIIAADVPRRAATADPTVESPPGAKGWANGARRVQRALIRSWITRFAG